MDKIEPSYKSASPQKELLKYSPSELRHTANWIDRDKNNVLFLNVVSMFIKLRELNAELDIRPDSSGSIEFELNGKSVIRYFESASELSTALNLGPLDLNKMSSELYFKADVGTFKASIIEKNSNNNTIIVSVPEIDLTKMIYLNGAEKILCNHLNGMTAGQLKVREIL